MGKRLSAVLILAFVGLPALGFAVVSGLFNASYAATLGHSGREASIWIMASVLVTVFLTGLPLAIEVLRERVPHLAFAARGLWLAAMAFSFISAMGFSALTRGQTTAENTAAIREREGLERAIERAENELSALGRHRSQNAIQADLQATQSQLGLNCSRRRNREACQPVFQLRAELAASHDANVAEQRLQELRNTLANKSVTTSSANPQADVLSWIGGGVLAAATWEKVLTVFVAGLIELSAALGLGIAARAVLEILRDEPEPQQTVEEPQIVESHPGATMSADMAFTSWFGACVSLAKGSRVSPKDAYAHYETWLSLNSGKELLPYVTFGRRMSEAVEAIGGKIGKSNNRYYGDVSLVHLGTNGIPLDFKEAAE